MGAQHFEKLLDSLNDRSADLGQCFSENIFYKSFENGLLTWESCAKDECKDKLRHGWGVINHFVKDIFGFDTKIKNLTCRKKEEKSLPKDDASEKISDPRPQAHTQTPPPTSQEMDAQPIQEPASMIEDEIMDISCVSGCRGEDASSLDEASKEIDSTTIMDEPMIKKAQEMFEATKITIQSKV